MEAWSLHLWNSGFNVIQPNPTRLEKGRLMHRELIAILGKKAFLLLCRRSGQAYHFDTCTRQVSRKLIFMQHADTRPDDPSQAVCLHDT